MGCLVQRYKEELEKAIPEVEVPIGITGIYGESLNAVKLPKGFRWVNGEEILDILYKKYNSVLLSKIKKYNKIVIFILILIRKFHCFCVYLLV